MKKYALISVSDKSGIVELGKALTEHGFTLLATGNTAKLLREQELAVTEVSDFTGFPEVFDGRVKTLQPKVFGGILFRRDNNEDKIQAEQHAIERIDVVCVNLYPFAKVAADSRSTEEELIENIDIGGPSLIRAAAKNHLYVSVLTSPNQYRAFISELEQGSGISVASNKKLALEAFAYTAAYDTHIANVLEERFVYSSGDMRVNHKKIKELRYGENPHQHAELYGSFFEYFEQIHGKELSYNNILDMVASAELVEELPKPACAIIKHNNPSGVAVGVSSLEAYNKALVCDPVSAFGGIVAFNTAVDEIVAEQLNAIFLEVVIAPEYTAGALELLKKKKDRRLIIQKRSVLENGHSYRQVPGGLLRQETDKITKDFDNLKQVTSLPVTPEQMNDLKLAWVVAKHAKSNAIVFVKNGATVGIGAGQVSRIDSVKIAGMKAKEFKLELEGAVAASDAFFPFPDGVEQIAEYGIKAIVQPGGSVRDDDVFATAETLGLCMVLTGIRHFKH